MRTSTYILTGQVHLAKLKLSLAKGTKFEVTEDGGKLTSATFSGNVFTDTAEVAIIIKNRIAIPYVKGETEIKNDIRVMKSAEEKVKKLPVFQSDDDLMGEPIDISHTKTEAVKERQARERAELLQNVRVDEDDDVRTVRGMKIINADRRAININNDNDLYVAIEGDDSRVVKKIGESVDATEEVAEATKPAGAKKTATKKTAAPKRKVNKEAEKRAKENAARRVKEAEENMAKLEAIEKTKVTSEAE